MDLINTDVPEPWNRAWLGMWFVVLIAVPISALFLSFYRWSAVAAIAFGLPEAISLLSGRDSLPPLTQTIRHFLPGWFAFTYIYFMLGSIGATWLRFANPFRVGAIVGLLGWLTEHFTATYANPDPMPGPARQTVSGPPPPTRRAL
jgi:hypothetical protein